LIPQAFITEWQARAPWPQPVQIEQDLILSRLMIEVATREPLADEFVMRGGTCLHKLHLPKPHRYSEDLDYVRRARSGVGPYLDALRELAADVGLEVQSVEQKRTLVHVILDAEPTTLPGRIRIKIETNIAETEFFQEPITIEHAVDSRWWRGEAKVPTFALTEMMATKVRALYQRSKGRDLFDLWLVLTTCSPDPATIVAGLRHYMEDGVFSYRELAANLRGKLEDADFRSDLDPLLLAVPDGYTVDGAADLVVEQLGALLDNAPDRTEIDAGAWRV
jgi:predicted nucleotidyltransferase component of viral defense system